MIKKLTIVIPVYNEEQAIEETLNKLMTYCLNESWEIVVVNDGSTDSSKRILEKFKDIRIIEHKNNKGYGASLKSGILSSNSDKIAFFDADGQHSPKDLFKLYEKFNDCEMIVGARDKSSHQEWRRKPGKYVLKKIAEYLSESKIPDLNSGLRIVNKEVLINTLPLLPNGFSFTSTLTIALFNLGYTIKYEQIKTDKRKGSSSVNQLKDGASTILLIIRLIILFNPLKVFIPVSVYLMILGIIYEIIYGIVLVEKIRVISGALLLMLTSVIIFFFGLVVDQISELRKQLLIKRKI